MSESEKKRTSIIAVCGKGGVGKTSISAMIVKILSANPDKKVLAIDADPAVGLASALGIEVHKTVDDIRNDLIRRVQKGTSENKDQILKNLDYEMYTALAEKKNLAFLAIGRPEKEGCYCQVNHMLKDLIVSMADNFDYVVIDGEAGIEQVNRRVMEKVTHLLLVSDPSAKGLNVAKTIKEVSDSAVAYEKHGLIINRIRDESEFNQIRMPTELAFLGWIPEDNSIRSFDIEGRSILEMDNTRAVSALEKCLDKIGLTNSYQISGTNLN
jgi:CO dehydrogenase maturation factor